MSNIVPWCWSSSRPYLSRSTPATCKHSNPNEIETSQRSTSLGIESWSPSWQQNGYLGSKDCFISLRSGVSKCGPWLLALARHKSLRLWHRLMTSVLKRSHSCTESSFPSRPMIPARPWSSVSPSLLETERSIDASVQFPSRSRAKRVIDMTSVFSFHTTGPFKIKPVVSCIRFVKNASE